MREEFVGQNTCLMNLVRYCYRFDAFDIWKVSFDLCTVSIDNYSLFLAFDSCKVSLLFTSSEAGGLN